MAPLSNLSFTMPSTTLATLHPGELATIVAIHAEEPCTSACWRWVFAAASKSN